MNSRLKQKARPHREAHVARLDQSLDSLPDGERLVGEPAEQLGAFAAFTASITWAYASTRYAEAASRAGSVRINLLRAVFALLLWFSALAIAEGLHTLTTVSSTRALYLAGSIVCSYAFGDGLFFAAAARLGISSALAIATIYPLWAALYGALFRGEPFGAVRGVGLLFCLAGVSALLKLSREPGPTQTARGKAALGVLLALGTSLCWAGNAVLLKLGAEGISLYQANTLRFAFGALLLAAQLPRKPTEGASPPARLLPLARSLALPLLADTGLGSVCFVYGIANTDLALGATLSSLSPLVAMPVAAALGVERLTWPRALAVTVTVCGVVLMVLAHG